MQKGPKGKRNKYQASFNIELKNHTTETYKNKNKLGPAFIADMHVNIVLPVTEMSNAIFLNLYSPFLNIYLNIYLLKVF